MRQRNIKDVENKIKAYEHFLVRSPWELAGKWREHLSSKMFDSTGSCEDSKRSLYIEIGSGKGRFLINKSASDSSGLYVGFEGQHSALYRALVKTSEATTPILNFQFCPEYVYDIREFFAEGEVSGIYLNFSDPWPKKRQEKRRLTAPAYLDGYAHVLSRGGFIEFKTDNDGLFSYSVEKIRENHSLELVEAEENLHSSSLSIGRVETEYEHKFRNLNRPIHFLRAEYR
jgi:tRNA (guanine-N7-)-methyltransferase